MDRNEYSGEEETQYYDEHISLSLSLSLSLPPTLSLSLLHMPRFSFFISIAPIYCTIFTSDVKLFCCFGNTKKKVMQQLTGYRRCVCVCAQNRALL